jgi:tagatose 6-phosphate kinase
MILTVTLNVALDVTYGLPKIEWRETNRVTTVSCRAGGKGVNVARVLHSMGVDVMVCGLAGGVTGDAIRADLAAAGIPNRLVRIDGESRRTLVLAEPDHATLFNEPGPRIWGEDWGVFLTTFAELIVDCQALVLSGSLPPSVPDDAYAVLLRMAADASVPGLLDAEGMPLRAGLSGRPAIAKPNARELEAVVGRAGTTVPELLHAAGELRTWGAESVVVTRGADGLVASTPDGNWAGVAPERISGNPTGAGDAVAAALVLGLVEGQPWPARLADALALGTAAVRADSAGDVDLDAYQTLRPAVRLEKL